MCLLQAKKKAVHGQRYFWAGRKMWRGSVQGRTLQGRSRLEGKIVSSCVCVIIPNLTRNVRPYAFVENVVTHGDYRGEGYAAECLHYAEEIARRAHCYKMMLLTGSKQESTLNFYRNAGYNSADKTAFIKWFKL